MTSVQWMILAHEQVVTEYFFFFLPLKVQNEFVSQCTYL